MIEVYSKENCAYCLAAKNTLRRKNVQFKDILIGRDITREDVQEKFPQMKSTPIIVHDGKVIGGSDNLVEYIYKHPEIVGEK